MSISFNTPTKNLQQFLADYVAWVEAGAPKDKVFRRTSGLCANMRPWAKTWAIALELRGSLALVLQEQGLCPNQPFNDSAEHFQAEVRAASCHLNTKRLAWARQHMELQ